MRVWLLAAAGCVATAAAADTPPPPTTLDALYAFESAQSHDTPYESHTGVGSVDSSTTFPNGMSITNATASVAVGVYPDLTLTTKNPTASSAASAYGELRYQYLATFELQYGANFYVNDAYANVVTLHAMSAINSTGPASSLTIATTAPGSFAQHGVGLMTQVGDGAGGAYVSNKTYDFSAPANYVGTTTSGGVTYANFKGTIRIVASLSGGGAGTFATLDVDPKITASAAFAAANHLGAGSITLSPGVANANGPSAAPEPAAWAMLVAGFGLTGAVARRRRLATA